MRRSLSIAVMAGLALALAAIYAVRAGLDQPLLAALRAIDARVAASMVIAAVLVQVALFLRVREDEERPTAGRARRAPRTRMGRMVALGTGSVPVIARRTGLPQDVVALALRRTREPLLAGANPAGGGATRQNRPNAATLATEPGSLNGLIRRITRS
ncbi:MAG: hypothetical protein P3B98_01290 [Gemmatimonadota bacterium]|nr:hypothetical protein [Gemmatimonadota bacterium]